MTIQRQYSLPNCKLVLEGWEDSSNTTSMDGRPLLSMVANVECYLAGHDKPLSGGREFLESLARVVNRYAQEFLSGVSHPLPEGEHSKELVNIQRLEGDRHRLTVRTPAGENGLQPPNGEAMQSVDLLTVQLFDLVEAIDQMVADGQTLPTVSLNLTPISRRFVRAQEPAAQRAVPAAIGISSLAAMAIAFFFIPVNDYPIPEPDPAREEQLENGTTPTGLNGNSPPIDPASDLESPPVDAEPPADDADPDTNPADAAPEEDSDAGAELNRESSVTVEPETRSEDGEAEDSALESSASSGGSSRPVSANGRASEAEMTELLESAPLIADSDQVDELTQVLRDRIADDWDQSTTFDEDLVYRVGVDADGNIVGFRYVNDAALENIDETPLLDLVVLPTNEVAAGEEPIGQFRVVFTNDGVIQVSPWYGRPSN
ncbi:MAG: DUF4335 domain-containing protein [Synechococcales bacterium]|nr:DUF4335 domain-containing protein [Synechococcales bacterium]